MDFFLTRECKAVGWLLANLSFAHSGKDDYNNNNNDDNIIIITYFIYFYLIYLIVIIIIILIKIHPSIHFLLRVAGFYRALFLKVHKETLQKKVKRYQIKVCN